MKYFFEIENWQKYFGFIFKQGSNACTTSMHPTPLIYMQIGAVRISFYCVLCRCYCNVIRQIKTYSLKVKSFKILNFEFENF
jgi:hypothetical protein